MTQNTNSAAFLQLRPIQNNDIGAIVEEHIRYWKEFKDDQEAKKLAREARQQEFTRKLNKDAFETYQGLSPKDTAGFLNHQLISRFEEESPKIIELVKQAQAGDTQAVLKLDNIKREIGAITEINKKYTAQAVELEKQKQEGKFNPFLDSNIERYQKALAQGKFVITKDFKVGVYNPVTDSLNIEEPSNYLNNSFLNLRYSGGVDFVKTGEELSKNLLDTRNGEQIIDKQTGINGTLLANNKFAENQVLAESWYENAKQKGLISFSTPFNQLDNAEKNLLARSFYENNILPNIQEVIDPNARTKDALDIANKRASLTNKRLDAEKKRQEISNKTSGTNTIEVATDDEGNLISNFRGTSNLNLFTLPKTIKKGAKDDSGNVTKFHSVARLENGDFVFLGDKVVREQTGVDDNGKPIFGNTLEPVSTGNPAEISTIIRQIPTGKGKEKFKTAEEFSNFASKKLEEFNNQKSSGEGLNDNELQEIMERAKRRAQQDN